MIACSPLCKLMAVALWSVLPVKVQTNSGKSIEGDLLKFKSDSVVIDQGGDSVEIAFDDIDRLVPEGFEEQTPPTYRVTLVGGSKIQVDSVQLTDSDLIVEPGGQNALRIPVKQVKAIRFRAPSQATDAAWFGNVEREARGDSLVIRRPGNKLDPQQGVIVSIQDDKVAFDLDGTVVNAPIDRLEGLVFGGTEPNQEVADVQITDVSGSQWSAVAVAPSEGEQPLQLLLTSSLKHEIPLYQIMSIRWSGGLEYLASNQPVSESLQTYFQTSVDDGLLGSFFGIRRAGEQNLSMVGGSAVEYRVESGFRTFAGSVRLDSTSNRGNVKVTISLDGKPVWEQSLTGPAPKGFELNINETRRLSIAVDFGDGSDNGDRVLFLRPRLLK